MANVYLPPFAVGQPVFTFPPSFFQACDYFDCDGDQWLQNLDEKQENELQKVMQSKFQWLEQQLGFHGSGPFFLGVKPSLLDAMYVGFLSRVETNYRFFKQFDVHDASNQLPHLVAWLVAMKNTRGGQRTWQPPSNDQRVYQSHPFRRHAAEPCQQLHPSRLGVGERKAKDWSVQLAVMRQNAPPACVPLAAGSPAALEAAHVLTERRAQIASFLLRKAGEAAAGDGYWQGRKHPRAGGGDWEQVDPQGAAGGTAVRWTGQYPPPYGRPDQKHRWPVAVGEFSSEEVQERTVAIQDQLLSLATVLAGICSPADKNTPQTSSLDTAMEGLVDIHREDGSVCAGELLLAPAFMSAAAEAQVEAALETIRQQDKMSTL